MKTIQKFLPRVRSNSVSSPRLYSSPALALFDSSAPPPSRPVLSSSRLSIEAKPAEVEGTQNSQHQSHSHPPFSLALTQPQSSSTHTLTNSNPQGQYALFPYSSLAHSSSPHPASPQQPPQDTHPHPRPKRQRLKYQLDVGAYGIPKRCRPVPSSSRRHHTHAHQHHSLDDLSLSVQVGEDAYFVRDNAMGVADGVGGWSKSHSRPSSTPSALFARRLMHYCSAEVETSMTPPSSSSDVPATPVPIPTPPPTTSYSGSSRPIPPSRSHFSFTHHLKPHSPAPLPQTSPAWKWSDSSSISMSSSLPTSWTLHDMFASSTPPPPPEPAASEPSYLSERDQEDLEADLEDSLDELSEGIDVLQILERAYDTTLKAHVVPPPRTHNSIPPPPTTATATTSPSSPSPPPSLTAESSISERGSTKPLLVGSSTALLAVLDHPPRPTHAPTSSLSLTSNQASASTSSASASSAPKKATETPFTATTATATAATGTTPINNNNNNNNNPTPVECELEECGSAGYDAVIKIAHVGDCMGMLVRGEDIVWRSEEMWWDFNTPVQLGPSTSQTVTPRNSAQVITLPVKADDILILASDGLSDNLWDEDVLDEVLRFKKSFLASEKEEAAAAAAPTTSTPPAGTKDQTEKPVNENDDSGYSSTESSDSPSSSSSSNTNTNLKRKTLAGMLSEALCSRARRVSERRPLRTITSALPLSPLKEGEGQGEDEVPFARRAREAGKRFSGGGKNDDISVVVAVISPK
ncbi:hypothetical protein P691DRAFT_779630 [Macrolepiota fuliginosa MF-IS2]|uniref:Protein phosphatase n=1 Tax=Macrolepiota fuliginosa MF-IS2 TaxID=1400762 RepID=A0A9P5WZB3_9AGAR|nr:hypothetical protein P691DRAFT_779630 [Macrolepiota fuliginosa MF-IS2]